MGQNDTKNTQVFLEEYKGNKTFSIWEVDAEGNKLGKAPVISFGRVKAVEILKHQEAINLFVNGSVEGDL